MFWHDDWEDFFTQCTARSQQFVKVTASSLTVFPDEAVQVNVSGAYVGPGTTINGIQVTVNNNESTYGNGLAYGVTIPSVKTGSHTVVISTTSGETAEHLNRD